jgi:hypothetical protein
MVGMIEQWRRWRAGAPRRAVDRELAAVRRRSEWLAKRPFSDKYDGDDRAGGYFGAASGSSGRSLEDDEPFELPPVPPHPRAGGRS